MCRLVSVDLGCLILQVLGVPCGLGSFQWPQRLGYDRPGCISISWNLHSIAYLTL